MATTYCQHTDISAFLQIADFSGSTAVTQADVESIINRREDYIDMRLGHAFRAVTVTNEYRHERGITTPLIWGDIWVKIHLDHRSVRDLASGSGDSLEVWNGSEWDDYLTSKTEGRTEDFWLDYTDGILFIRRHIIPHDYGIRITYRYGETAVPGWVEHLCILLTAHDLVMSEGFSNTMPTGGDSVPYVTKAERWKAEAEEIIASRAEWFVGAI